MLVSECLCLGLTIEGPGVPNSKYFRLNWCFGLDYCQGRKSSCTELNDLNWTNWTEALGPGVLHWIELIFQIHWSLRNQDVLNWCQTSLNLWTIRPCKSPRSIRVRTGKVHELSGMNWTKLNGGTWPRCPELNWTIFSDKLVPRELNCIELMPGKFELWGKRFRKFTNPSGPNYCLLLLKVSFMLLSTVEKMRRSLADNFSSFFHKYVGTYLHIRSLI